MLSKKQIIQLGLASALLLPIQSCGPKKEEKKDPTETVKKEKSEIQRKVEEFIPVKLKADLNHLSENQKKMIGLFIEAGQIMDKLFWLETYGPKEELLAKYDDEYTKKFIEINYGPWERLNDNIPFLEGFGEKPKGAKYYPADMTKEEFDASGLAKSEFNQYSFISRDKDNKLVETPFNVAFKEDIEKAASLLEQAAELAEDKGFKKYLELRAKALRTDKYYDSDMAWMEMKTNMLDVVIGPIENYEDKLYNYRTAHECYVLVKDMKWSERLAKYAKMLPELQKGLPAEEKYKKEEAGSKSDLNAYDVIFYAGDCNAGSKTIAINLPNDERVQLANGSRRLQLKNAMRAKFDNILIPIADELIDPSQRKHITFDAFFGNTMFHEVAHGLGIKNTINNKGTVKDALQETYSALEEGKADILGLYMITELHEKGEVEGELMDYYTTFLAGIFRSVRFGAASAHGQANMIRFNYFKEKGAFEKDMKTGKYKVNFEKMQEAMASLSSLILKLQGDGDKAGVEALLAEKGKIGEDLQKDLDKLTEKNIPVDVIFEQ